tara:strand:+ start:614 stop:2218 length:1605 start_codon:yes stop_codon:yes gene_type:complete
MSWSRSRPSQLIQLLEDAITSGDDDLADIIRSDLYREFGIQMADGGRVGMNTGGLPTVASVLGLQSLSAQQNPTSTPDLDALGLQSLLPPRPDLAAMTQQAGNPMNVPIPYHYGYGPSADFGRRNLDALTYTGDTTFPTLQQIFGQDAGTLTQEELDARLAEQQGNLSSTYQSQIDAKTEAMKQAQAQHAAALAEQQATAASASAQAQSQEAALQAQLDELRKQLEAAQNVQPQIQYVPQYIQRPLGTGPGGGGSCFVAGTLVTMEDGTLKKIEEVEIGDKVKGEEGVNMVTDYDHPPLGDRKLYSINNGDAFVTSEHPFKTLEGWKSIDPEDTAKETDLDVKKLDVGDIIITGKDDVKVDSIEEHDGNAEDTVYNFILNGDRTYYADGYLVHNKGGGGGGGGCFVEGTPIDMADGTTKEITGIRVGEETKGGRVIAKLEFEPTKIYNYQGVYVSGTHLVREGNEMVEVQNSKHGILTDRIEPVYCFETTNNRIWVQGIEFGDYLTGSQKDWEPYIEMMRKKVNAEIQDRHQEV